MNRPATVAPGQTVYVEWRTLRDSYEPPMPLRVAKVGRTWAVLDARYHKSHRFALAPDDTGSPYRELDGGNWMSPGRVWFSMGDHAEYCRRVAAWDALRAVVRAYPRPPEHIPTADLEGFAELLRRKAPVAA